MSQIRSSENRSTEKRFRAHLIQAGISGWTLKNHSIFGKPDFIFPTRSIALFIDGCFWHSCKKCGRPSKSNKSYWVQKMRRNRQRDASVSRRLKAQGWSVLRIWEHEIKYPQYALKRISNLYE